MTETTRECHEGLSLSLRRSGEQRILYPQIGRWPYRILRVRARERRGIEGSVHGQVNNSGSVAHASHGATLYSCVLEMRTRRGASFIGGKQKN